MTFPRTGPDRESVEPGPNARAGEAATRGRVLVVDGDDAARGALEKLLRASGFAASTASDAEAAIAEATRTLPDVVLTDLQVQPVQGGELCQRLHEIDHGLPVIVMTAFSEMPSVVESLRVGAEDYLVKPLHDDTVLWCVERAIARRIAKRKQEETSRTLNERLLMSSIREQEHAEAEAQQRAQLGALLENLSDGVVIADESGLVLMINDAARAIWAFGDADVRTVDVLHSVEAHDLRGQLVPNEQRALSRALRGEQFVDHEMVLTRPNGERRRVVSTGTSVKDESGSVALAIVVYRDVTELRRLEQKHEEYLALISHDLRNPLGSIVLFVDVLKTSVTKKGLAEELRIAERVERNVKRVLAMLEELTEATNLESRGVALQRKVCDLLELAAGVVDRMDDARARRITIETDDSSSYVVFADAARLERVIANLLTNALKYSAEDAPVTARLARKESSVALEVIDRGIGIAPESVGMLFDRYYRARGGKARASGLGLGLYIARLIVESHGGRIDVSSEVGRGSTFRLILPSHSLSKPSG
jgi:PAS domain S-box-containing protein